MTTHALGTVGAMYRDKFQIQPISAAKDIHAGKVLEFFSPSGFMRTGTARVTHVDYHFGVIQVETNLNVAIPAIAECDTVREWVMPCTRCRCKECERAWASPRVGDAK